MFDWLQSIDRRIVYLFMIVCVGAALIFKADLPVIPSNQAVHAYEAIEKAPTDKYALIGAEWAASTRGENGAQTIALFHHLMRRHIRFAIIGFDPQGPDNVAKIAKQLSAEYHYEYGKD